MLAKIIKCYKEEFPQVRLIGKKYTEDDRIDGSFSHKWGEWFSNDMFTPLEKLPQLKDHDNGYLGVMRINNGQFEYWIGLFLPKETSVPKGYDYIDIESLSYAVCFVYGNEQKGEIYGLDNYNNCLVKLEEQGFVRYEDYWCFERYNCPRYTTPDEFGNIILDYAISIEK